MPKIDNIKVVIALLDEAKDYARKNGSAFMGLQIMAISRIDSLICAVHNVQS